MHRRGVLPRFAVLALLCQPSQGGSHVPQTMEEYDEQFLLRDMQEEDIYPVLAEIIGNFVRADGGVGQNSEAPSSPSSAIEAGSRGPFSVVDVGCGHGRLVEAFRKNGVEKSFGVEASATASQMWPEEFSDEYYRFCDLKTAMPADVPKTDVVTSFEVAEHLPPTHGGRFVKLLVSHDPAYVFFGAATVLQDEGANPSHLNENTLTYWVEHFKTFGYVPHMLAAAKVRVDMIHNEIIQREMNKAWWYPKNTLVFVPKHRQKHVDALLISHPKEIDMLSEGYLNLFQGIDLEAIWRRDWTEFGTIFYKEQDGALKRESSAALEQGEL